MNKHPLPLVLAAAAGFAFILTPINTRAAIALDFGGGSRTITTNVTRGWVFTLSSAVSVNELGFFDRSSDGLADSHQLTIWTSAGVPVITGTMPAGTVSVLDGPTYPDGQFRYLAITSTLLVAGSYCYVTVAALQ